MPGLLAMADAAGLLEIVGQPFMQRALLGGLLTGALGGLLGSFAVLRQLSFFSDALGHSALLGISLGILLGINPTLVLIPFAVLFALLVNQLVARSGLPADALLNIVYSTSLAFAVVALSLVETYRGGIQQLLFGDILGISWSDLTVIAVLLLGAFIYLALSLRAQVLLTLNSDLAGAFGAAGTPTKFFLNIIGLTVYRCMQKRCSQKLLQIVAGRWKLEIPDAARGGYCLPQLLLTSRCRMETYFVRGSNRVNNCDESHADHAGGVPIGD